MLEYSAIFCIGVMSGLSLTLYNDYIQRRLYISMLMYLENALLDILYSVIQSEKDIEHIIKKIESYINFISERLDEHNKIREEIEASIKNSAQEDEK